MSSVTEDIFVITFWYFWKPLYVHLKSITKRAPIQQIHLNLSDLTL